MTIAAPRAGEASAMPQAAIVLPVLGVVYQLAATMTARACAQATGARGWLAAAATAPWFWLLIASEVASFLVWASVLARMPLSRAFPITALGYVLVVAVSVTALHQPLRPIALLGSAMILAGAALLATDAS